MEITLQLPVPPTINHYYGYRNRFRTKYITADGKTFRHHVALEVMIAGAKLAFLEDTRLALDVVLHLKSRAGDIDNRIKPLFDALEAATVFPNDRQIDEFHVKRGKPMKDGRCVVRIWERAS